MSLNKEKQFVLLLLKCVFQTSNRSLPFKYKTRADTNLAEERSYFTTNIKNAILMYIDEYSNSGEVLPDVDSLEFRDKLMEVNTHKEFLKFLGYYCKKTVSEYLEDLEDTLSIFYAAVFEVLTKFKISDQYDKFWEGLDQIAKKLADQDNGKTYGQCPPSKDIDDEVDTFPNEEFTVNVINYLLTNVFEVPANIKHHFFKYLPKYDSVKKSESLLTTNIENAFYAIWYNQSTVLVRRLGENNAIYDHFYNVCTKSFNESDFLDFCVCCVNKAVTECMGKSKDAAAFEAYDLIVRILEHAKEDGKPTSFQKMEEAGIEQLKLDSERAQHKLERLNILKRRRVNVDSNLIAPINESKKVNEAAIDTSRVEGEMVQLKLAQLNIPECSKRKQASDNQNQNISVEADIKHMEMDTERTNHKLDEFNTFKQRASNVNSNRITPLEESKKINEAAVDTSKVGRKNAQVKLAQLNINACTSQEQANGNPKQNMPVEADIKHEETDSKKTTHKLEESNILNQRPSNVNSNLIAPLMESKKMNEASIDTSEDGIKTVQLEMTQLNNPVCTTLKQTNNILNQNMPVGESEECKCKCCTCS